MNRTWMRWLLLIWCTWALAAHDQTVSLPAPGQYAVACSNLALDEGRLATGVPTSEYWSGFRGHYMDSLLTHPDLALSYRVQPADPRLYPTTAGQNIPVLALLCYPTDSNNPDPDYRLPGTETTLPHMHLGGAPRIHAGLGRLPLVVYSHGIYTSPVDLDREVMMRLASGGYMVFAPFHGDGRWGQTDLTTVSAKDVLRAAEIYREVVEKITLRALQLKVGLDVLLQHPHYRDRIHLNRIAAVGTCFGAPPLLALLGARLSGSVFGGEWLDTPRDDRFKTMISLVPFSGTEMGLLRVPLYGSDQQGTSNVRLPQLAVVGSVDTVSPPPLTATALAQSQSAYLTLSLTGYNHKDWIEPAAAEVSAWTDIYLRAYLLGDVAAYDRLQSMANIAGGVDDQLQAVRDSAGLPAAVADALFDRAEQQYPGWFASGPVSGPLGSYYGRCYASGYCLGRRDQTVYVYDGVQLFALGDLRDWANWPASP